MTNTVTSVVFRCNFHATIKYQLTYSAAVISKGILYRVILGPFFFTNRVNNCAFLFAPSLTRVSPISNRSKTGSSGAVWGSANHTRCLLACSWSWPAGCNQPSRVCRCKTRTPLLLIGHIRLDRQLPNVRKIKCKYICAETVPTTARQYAGKQRNGSDHRTNHIAATERKACRLRNRGSSRSFQHLTG